MFGLQFDRVNQSIQLGLIDSYPIYASTTPYFGTISQPNTTEKKNVNLETTYSFNGETFKLIEIGQINERFGILNKANRIYTFGLYQVNQKPKCSHCSESF